MEHKSQDELAALLQQAESQVQVGAHYRHFKGGEYVVESLAILEATNEVAVIYRAEYDTRLRFIRPLTSWLERVDQAGKTTPAIYLIQSSGK